MSLLNYVITQDHSDDLPAHKESVSVQLCHYKVSLLAKTNKTSALNYVITKDHTDELLAQAKKMLLCLELCQHTERINLMTRVNTKNGSV